MARKKLTAEEKLSEVLSLKVTPPDRDAWRAKVEASGLSSSEFFRRAVLANQAPIVGAPLRSPERLQLLRAYTSVLTKAEALLERTAGPPGGASTQEGLLIEFGEVMDLFRRELNRAD